MRINYFERECLKFQNVRFIIVLFFIFFCVTKSYSQSRTLDVGLRFQKTVNLYYENGVTLQYSNEQFLEQRLFLGLSYVSSRLGSAINSNALQQDNYLLSATYFFRPSKNFQTFVRLNTGYFTSNLESEIFKDIPDSSFVLSPEAGIGYKTNSPVKIGTSLGYNLITGDGINGPGTLFPLFFQTSLTWNIFHTSLDK